MDRGAYPIVLSLSPVIGREMGGREIGHAYQARCVAAWQACGFRVITVNAAAEAPRIKAFYPDVEIAIATRDMSALCGKPLVPLAEMIAVLRRTGSPLGGIVNSDVFLPPHDITSWLGERLGPAGLADCLFVNRMDLAHPAAAAGPIYRYGFDAFFFRLDALEDTIFDPFTIGLPWWDYYLPMSLILEGRSVAAIEQLPLRHLAHSQKWSRDSWNHMFEIFRDRLHDRFVRLERKRGREIPALATLLEQDALTHRPLPRTGDGVDRHREAYSVSIVDLIFRLSDVVGAPAAFAGERP